MQPNAEFRAHVRADAEMKVRAGLLMAEIAKAKEVKVTDADIEKAFEELAEQTGKNVAKVRPSTAIRRSARCSSAWCSRTRSWIWSRPPPRSPKRPRPEDRSRAALPSGAASRLRRFLSSPIFSRALSARTSSRSRPRPRVGQYFHQPTCSVAVSGPQIASRGRGARGQRGELDAPTNREPHAGPGVP
jgi:hypothetical protein